MLPIGSNDRKDIPIYTGVVKYFPDALAEVAKVSQIGNEQHSPGQPLHWARGKSMDQEDCLMRHLLESGTRDIDGQRHSAKVAWRALAILQLEIENDVKSDTTRGSTSISKNAKPHDSGAFKGEGTSPPVRSIPGEASDRSMYPSWGPREQDARRDTILRSLESTSRLVDSSTKGPISPTAKPEVGNSGWHESGDAINRWENACRREEPRLSVKPKGYY